MRHKYGRRHKRGHRRRRGHQRQYQFQGAHVRPRYSKRTENFKRPKNREDSSDLDENLTESIAAMRSIISKIFGAARLEKQRFQKFFRASCCLNIYRCPFPKYSDVELV